MGRTLVTGATGFVGRRWLERALEARPGERPIALARKPPTGGDDVGGPDAVEWIRADLERPEEVRAAIESCRPSHILHLAAVANPRVCAASPDLARRVNVEGTRAVLEGAASCSARVVIVSTAAVYGRAAGRLDETTACEPASVYGRTKLESESLVDAIGVEAVVARPFNHSGSGQSTDYVLPALAARIVASLRSGEPVVTGNLFPKRDFLHVDDVVAAYERLLDGPTEHRVHNVCRGAGLSIGDALAGLQRRLGAEGQRTRVAPELARPDDAPSVVGDPGRLCQLGWAPAIDVEGLLDDVASPWL